MQILRESRERFGQGKWIFPSGRTGTHLEAGTLTRSLKRRKHFDLPYFVPHDLRRTVASLCGKLKIQPHVIDRILGHVLGGVAAVYRTYTYDDEMAEALQKWSGALDAILAGETIADYMQRSQPDNVVQLPIGACVSAIDCHFNRSTQHISAITLLVFPLRKLRKFDLRN